MMTDFMGKRELAAALSILMLLMLTIAAQCQIGPEAGPGANAATPPRIFPETPVTVNDEGLPGALRVYSPFVLDCWELGCRPCQFMDSKIDQMAAEYKGKIAFGKLCIDYNPLTVRDYALSRTPTILVFNNSTLVCRQVGDLPQDELEENILTVLNMRGYMHS